MQINAHQSCRHLLNTKLCDARMRRSHRANEVPVESNDGCRTTAGENGEGGGER